MQLCNESIIYFSLGHNFGKVADMLSPSNKSIKVISTSTLGFRIFAVTSVGRFDSSLIEQGKILEKLQLQMIAYKVFLISFIMQNIMKSPLILWDIKIFKTKQLQVTHYLIVLSVRQFRLVKATELVVMELFSGPYNTIGRYRRLGFF